MRERAGCQPWADLFGAEAKVEVADQTEGLRQELRLPGWVPRCQG